MLIARAPVRISLAGGGTDLESYYRRYGGLVISTAIDKYFYVMVSPLDQADGVQIISSDYHTFYRHDPRQPFFWNGNLQLPRAVLHHFGLERGYSLFLASEVPPGTGLGSSGSVAVALVRALSALRGMDLSRGEIAELAAHIEIEKMGMPVGKQDQYSAAFGGINVIRFETDGVQVCPLEMPDSARERLEASLLLFFTGSTRDSSSILRHQKRASEADDLRVVAALHTIKRLALDVLACLEAGDCDAFGELLHASWEQKKRLAPNVTTPYVDHCYELARRQGALGGKLTGAGGGGFLMLYCPVERQEAVTTALEAEGVVRMNFRFDTIGTAAVGDLEFGCSAGQVGQNGQAHADGFARRLASDPTFA